MVIPYIEFIETEVAMIGNANMTGVYTTFSFTETLLYKDGEINRKVVSKGTVSRPVGAIPPSRLLTRDEWELAPDSAYKWTWFDHDDNVIAIQYDYTEVKDV